MTVITGTAPSRTRVLQLRALSPALARSVRWQPTAVAAVAAGALLWWQADQLSDPPRALWMLRAVALLLAVGAAFALDDRSRTTLAAVPTPLWWRTSARLAGVVAVAAAVWVAALAWTVPRVAGGVPLALTLEAAAVVTIALAVASGLARWGGVVDPGVIAAPTLLGVGLLLTQLPGALSLTALPGPAWESAHLRWAVLLLVAFAVLVASLRDPAATDRWRVRPSPPAGAQGGGPGGS